MVLSIAHMSMVIFPIIFYIFHMSGVKKKRKNQKEILEPRLVYSLYVHGYPLTPIHIMWAIRYNIPPHIVRG